MKVLKNLFILFLFPALLLSKQNIDSYRAIYENDDLRDPFKFNKKIQKISDSVALLISINDITNNEQGYTINENFNYEICTAFMISENEVMTAGHCFKELKCEETVLVFNYQLNKDGQNNKKLEIYHCLNLVSLRIPEERIGTIYENYDEIDYAIFKVSGSPGIKWGYLELDSQIPIINSSLLMIGHPSGGTKKIVNHCRILKNYQYMFGHDCDSFYGNSGSPILDTETLKVIGIQSIGLRDFDLNNKPIFYEPNNVSIHEKAIKISETFKNI